jgi:thiamine biosynthesis lipoprotein
MAFFVSRRRLLAISAGVAAAGLLPSQAVSNPVPSPRLHLWEGSALGARARICLHHPDAKEAQGLIARCVEEIGRLERIFSLYQPDSAISRLNRDGRLDEPPLDMVVLLSRCDRFSRLSGGAFDITVQPLWRFYAEHFARTRPVQRVPASSQLKDVLALIGHDKLRIDPAVITFDRPGMAVTLNGIAQGYITDRIVEILRAGGCDHVLADLGEIRALGPHPTGRPWQVGLEAPDSPGQVARTLEVVDRAVATSSPSGFQFEASGRFHHLLDPRTGDCPRRYASVSVIAPDAITADALSTALSVASDEEAAGLLATVWGVAALFTTTDGKVEVHGA